jgi:hypothetical protein
MRASPTGFAIAVLTTLIAAGMASAQSSYPCTETNSNLPNPYRQVTNWASPPRPWSPVSLSHRSFDSDVENESSPRSPSAPRVSACNAGGRASLSWTTPVAPKRPSNALGRAESGPTRNRGEDSYCASGESAYGSAAAVRASPVIAACCQPVPLAAQNESMRSRTL